MGRESASAAAVANGKRRAIVSESESEDGVPHPSPQKRRKVPAIIDSSDEDDPAGPSFTRSTKPTRRDARTRRTEDEDRQGDQDLPQRERGGSEDSDAEDNEAAAAQAIVSGQGAALGRSLGARPAYQRGDDGYVAGSIKRIKMINFLTYDSAEFAPGPHLNMILGPNGTGKSSIAAAIAIGLGFRPKVMGRAPDLKSYVKQGAEEAHLEIELKGHRGKKNPVIGMTFTRARDTSEWTLHGQKCARSKILEIVASYGVVADNLCSFLPQDKVADFAKLAPTQVLEETMRAAGDPRLTLWHRKLCETGETVIEFEQEAQREVANRDVLRKHVDRLAPDVRTYEERQDRVTEKLVLEQQIMARETLNLQAKSKELKIRRKRLNAAMIRHQESRAPLLTLLGQQDAKFEKAQVAEADVVARRKEQEKTVRDQGIEWNSIKLEAEAVDAKLGALKKKQRRRQEEKEGYESRIAKAEQILSKDVSEQRRQIEEKDELKKEKFKASRELGKVVNQLHADVEGRQREFQDIDKAINDARQEETRLSSIEALREQTASDFDPSIRYLLKWLKEHGDELEAEVHKPPMISVNVGDKTRAWQVEMCTSLSQRKTFICESKRDYERLLELNNTTYASYKDSNGRIVPAGKVRLDLAKCEPTERWANPNRPTNPRKLADLGFDGYAVDFVTAKPTVICYLNQYANLHATALSSKPATDVDEAGAAAAGIPMWVTADQATNVHKSRYGKMQAQFTTRPRIGQAKAFALVVDQDAIKRVQNTIGQKRKERKDKEADQKILEERYEKERQKMQKLLDVAKQVEAELEEMQKAIRAYAQAQADRDRAKNQLAELETLPSLVEERNKLRAEKLRSARKLLAPQSSTMAAAQAITNLAGKAGAAFWRRKHSQLDYQHVKEHEAQGDSRAHQLKQDLENVKKELEEIKQQWYHATELLNASTQKYGQVVMQPVWDMVQAAEKDEPIPELGELQGKLHDVEAQLALSTEIQPNIIARYKEFSENLEKSEQAVREREEELSHARANVKKILDNFNPALDTLVNVVSSKFSSAFERIGCAGEVEVDRVDGKYKEWGINIKVSYRASEPLQLLTGSRQSGGERSLATVTYLMSLSEMSRTPFSLVDEINQGMDQRAERRVHDALVETTCNTDAGQYFLITPKLLTGLDYHEKMKVLIINNGVYLPAEDKSIKVGSLKSNLLKVKQARAVAAH